MGGTFDPIHLGHLVAASEVHTALQLDQILFIPAGNPWQKAQREISSATDRLEMTRLAIADDSRFSLSDIEVLRSGPTYAIDTVIELLQRTPEAQFYWIVGADVAAQINTWHRWEEFLKLCSIVVVNRQGIDIGDLPFTFIEVQMPEVRISASGIRQRYVDGQPAKYLVPNSVDSYIKDRELYGTTRDNFHA
jgi:nicotinate-nucleotide adenylyltransferase